MSVQNLIVRVSKKTRETASISSFVLTPLNDEHLPPFAAGAHIDVHVPGPQPFIRQYSLCNPPSEADRYEIAVLNDPQGRGGSRAMHTQVQVGDTLEISPPRQNFPLRHLSGTCRLIGGGIGLTPMLAMAWELHMKGRPFHLHVCARTPAHVPFLERLKSAPFVSRISWHFNEMTPATTLDLGQLAKTAPLDEAWYVCGPNALLDAADQVTAALGWTTGRLNVERFVAAGQPVIQGDAFDLVLAKSGRVIHVGVQESAAKALRDGGIDLPLSCEQGVCGTCLTRVLEGTPDHRDSYLLPDERGRNDQFIPCCSRSLSPRMVIDL